MIGRTPPSLSSSSSSSIPTLLARQLPQGDDATSERGPDTGVVRRTASEGVREWMGMPRRDASTSPPNETFTVPVERKPPPFQTSGVKPMHRVEPEATADHTAHDTAQAAAGATAVFTPRRKLASMVASARQVITHKADLALVEDLHDQLSEVVPESFKRARNAAKDIGGDLLNVKRSLEDGARRLDEMKKNPRTISETGRAALIRIKEQADGYLKEAVELSGRMALRVSEIEQTGQQMLAARRDGGRLRERDHELLEAMLSRFGRELDSIAANRKSDHPMTVRMDVAAERVKQLAEMCAELDAMRTPEKLGPR